MERPKVGVGVIVLKEKKLLLGQRKGSHSQGEWAPPGGHLEFGEEVAACAKRELLEETGLNNSLPSPLFPSITSLTNTFPTLLSN